MIKKDPFRLIETPIEALKHKCKYKSHSCWHKPIKDGYCIFHVLKLPKENKEGVDPSDKVFIEDINDEFQTAFADLLNRLDSSKSEYDFTGFHFPPIELRKKVFHGPVNFSYAHFHGISEFEGASFEDTVYLYETVFHKEARFQIVTFKGKASFTRTHFLKGASFGRAIFETRPWFMTPSFEGSGVHFTEAVFKEGAWFRFVTFKQAVLFDQAIFGGHTSFDGKSDNGCFENLGRFMNIILEKDATIEFNDVDLSQMSFLNTNLERLKFRGVKWYVPPGRPRRKRALWDEFNPKTKDFHSYIAENYAQLVINYEKIRDYSSAEDFHIGEMEMRRKRVEAAIRKRKFGKYVSWINIHRLYRFLSMYGTSYWRAALIFGLLFLLCPLVFLISGLEVRNGETVSVIDYRLWPNFKLANISQFIADYFRALGYTFAAFTLQRDYPIKPLHTGTHLWQGLFSLLLVGQAGLVLLAIRRQFKR